MECLKMDFRIGGLFNGLFGHFRVLSARMSHLKNDLTRFYISTIIEIWKRKTSLQPSRPWRKNRA